MMEEVPEVEETKKVKKEKTHDFSGSHSLSSG